MPVCTHQVPFSLLRFVSVPEPQQAEWQSMPLTQIAKNHSLVTGLTNILTLGEGLCSPQHDYGNGTSDIEAVFSFVSVSLADLTTAVETIGTDWAYILIDEINSYFYWRTAVKIDTDSLAAADGGSQFSIKKVYRKRIDGVWQYSFEPFTEGNE